MTVLVSADWHFSDNPRDDYRHRFQSWLRKLVKEQDVDAVLMLGDLTEEKDRHSAWLVNKVVEHIDRLSELCPVVLLQGNHDAIDPDWPFYRFLERLDQVRWVNTPTDGQDLNIPALSKLGHTLFLPNAANPEKDWAQFDMGDYDWVFTHMTFNGADVGHGHKLSGLSTSFFPKDVEVVSGDIHVPQHFGNVTYVGAPYTVDFGDHYAPRVLLLNGQAMKSIPVEGPQKVLIDIDDLADLEKVTNVEKGDVLKVRVKLSNTDRSDWSELQRAIRAWGAEQGCTVHLVQPVLDNTKRMTGKKKERASSQRSDEELLREYAARMDLDPTTIKTGIRLLGEA